MIGYTTIGSNNFEATCAYYDALLAEFCATRMMDMDTFVLWSVEGGFPGFSVAKPFDGNPATIGNGVMIALSCADKDMVNRVYNKAIELGGSDEGAPGARGEGFYAGYFRDPEGNKLNAFTLG